MKFILLVFTFCIVGVISKTIKKSTEDVTTRFEKETGTKFEKVLKFSKSKSKQPAPIIAIEIVDPNENSTKSKNSKRTINSSLGYGFPQSNYYGVTDKPKLVFYKYSQHDIPPFRGLPTQTYEYGPTQHSGLDIKKSVEYDLGTRQHIEYNQPNVQQYQPGTTLFSTFNQNGQLGGLTSHLPQQNPNAPVILFKVYPNQLNNPIYPNLPESHPYAGLNNINLQSLLGNFLHDQNYNGQAAYQYEHQQKPYENQQYQQENQYQQQSYQYPQENQQYEQQNQQYYQPQQQQQYYENSQDNQNYQQGQSQEYYLNQPNNYDQQYQDEVQQQQYQQYQQPHNIESVYRPKVQYSSADNLPTHENYPDDSHTRVVFYSNSGHLKRPINDNQPAPVVPSSIKQNLQSTQTSSKYTTAYPPPQSYSSLMFHQSQESAQGQGYSLPQSEDGQGYYYYKPGESNYYQGQSHEYAPTSSGTITESGEIDTQKVKGPHNYHAHPNLNGKKRNARKPAVVKKITKVTKEED